jgi:putative dGTPase
MDNSIERTYNGFISITRVRKSSLQRSRIIDQFYSDRSRIIYSSSFRRLQQKAQVFSLEPNSSVRTRLTHSLEVSDLGRTLANQIAYRLEKQKKLTKDKILSLVAIVENACLLHDIGNPPFGHFGEAAIREWAQNDIRSSIPVEIEDQIEDKNSLLNNLINDFKEFDGNPQGFRIVTKLHADYDEYSLNLTYSTLLCILKYPRTTGEEKNEGILKKAGYFQTEKELVEKIYREVKMKLKHRYPFVYIMEAADDIAYCMSDIADGIEKGILTEEEFLNEFKIEWRNSFGDEKIPVDLPEKKDLKGFNQDISIPWSKKAMDEAVKRFILLDKEIYEGSAESLISNDKDMGRVLETMKNVSRRILYTSFEAESIEITGYAVITGILNKYSSILKMSYKDFKCLVNDEKIKGFDFEKRLFHLVGKRYIQAYKHEVSKNVETEENFLIKEWWLRAHLIIDHISGMTDEFALETYQMFEGIRLMR